MVRTAIASAWREAWATLLPLEGDDPVARRAAFERDAAGDYCGRCGATAAREAVTVDGCPHCVNKPVAWSGVWRLAAYGGDVRDWVLGYKFRRAWGWGNWFGRELAEAVGASAAVDRAPTPRVRPRASASPAGLGEPTTLVTSVPLHWTRRVRRTYDQAALMADAFGHAAGLPVAHLLRRTRRTRPQSTIASKEGRRLNVRGAFALRRPVDLTGATVWLIDDVKTTGATARVCAHLLRRAGAATVNLAVVAVADPKGADFTRG